MVIIKYFAWLEQVVILKGLEARQSALACLFLVASGAIPLLKATTSAE